MAISSSFAGANILRPGAYSQATTLPSGGSAATQGVLLLIGEADAGAPGSATGILSYPASAYSQLLANFKSGRIVNAAKVSLTPSQTPGIGGAGTILVYKTNASVQASIALPSSFGTLTAKEYGVGGNRITVTESLSAETQALVVASAPITNFGGLNTETLIVRINGGASTTVTFSSPASIADVLSQVNSALSSAGITASAPVTNTLQLAITASPANHQRDGWSQSIEVVGGTALALLFLSVGQFGVPAAEPQLTSVITQPRDAVNETNTVGGAIALQIGRDSTGSCTAASLSISSSALTLTQTGATPSSVVISFVNAPRIIDLYNSLKVLPGVTVAINPTLQNLPSTALDQVSSVGCFAVTGNMPGRIKDDLFAVQQMYAASIEVALTTTAVKGLPDAVATTNLSGGLKGASANSSFSAGLTAALGIALNVIVPCVSQDATADILLGSTDASSSYTITSVQSALEQHLILRSSVKNRAEAQGVTGFRSQTKALAYTQAATIGSGLVQLCMQDILVNDATGSLVWHQPHVLAAMIAGMRVGSPIGTPLTHKYLAINGAGHYVNSATGQVQGDFNPLIDYDAAITAGVTFVEPATGGQRVCVDNTTYGADASFVYNRGSVVQASQYIAQYIRNDLELAFVGQKNAVADAASIASRLITDLKQLFAAQITSPSTDAPNGYVPGSILVSITNNSASVSFEVKPVQAIDFIQISFVLGATTQTATAG